MERYVDMAYQRDGEEARRWAFNSLKDGLAHNPQFYPASEFRLYRCPQPLLPAATPAPSPLPRCCCH